MAEQGSSTASSKYNELHDKTASKNNLGVGNKVLIDIQLFVAKNKKFAPMCPSVYDHTNHLRAKCGSENQKQITNLQYVQLKKFLDAYNYKLKKNESIIKKHNVDIHKDILVEKEDSNSFSQQQEKMKR